MKRICQGQGIFLAYVDEPFVGADSIASNDQPLDDAVRVPFEKAAIHVGARITFIGVDDNVLGFSRSFTRALPFPAGLKPSPSASAKPCVGDFLDDCLGSHL